MGEARARAESAMRKVSLGAQDLARELDQRIAEVAGEKVAFSLFVWTRGRCTYVSSASDRREIIQVLEGMIAGWKAGMPDIPAHEVRG
jgi:hypothetical protein